MASQWQSRVWYDTPPGLEVTTGVGHPEGVRGPTYWRVHWCDLPNGSRVWLVSDTGQVPDFNCTLLQAAFPGVTVYWTNVPPEALFPLIPGEDPPWGPGTPC
jgi:hypothetical protein